MQALQIHAGPRALQRLREHGLAPEDVRAIPAAAGGAKGITLLPLDRFIFGHWLAGCTQTLHLLGASIGAWRMAAACRVDADAALAQLAEDYITQSYAHAPGRFPAPQTITSVLRTTLQQRLGGAAAAEVLAHPHRRLHVFTSRGRHLLHRPGRLRTPMGYLGAFAANAVSRRALGGWMERVVFSDPRDPLPVPLLDYPSRQVALDVGNLPEAVLASCAIPFALEPVQNVPGGPLGTYWDGGITDYHLHLDYRTLAEALVQPDGLGGAGAGLVLYPHFLPRVIPGWLDKAWRRRHRPTPFLDNLVLLSPRPEWVASLPNGKLPDRADFKTYGEDIAGRQRDWRRAYAESQRLADEFAQAVTSGRPVQALPLA